MTSLSVRLAAAYVLIALAPLVWTACGLRQTHHIDAQSITHVAGASYIASLPANPLSPLLIAASDDPSNTRRSTARLFEDDRELRPAHALHAGIAAVGRGRFSHWTTAVYLSASDNSDPRTNGRRYRLETVARLPMPVVLLWPLTFALAVGLSHRFLRSGDTALIRWLRYVRPAALAFASVIAFVLIVASASDAVRFWTLASWLVLGLVAALCGGAVVSRLSTRAFVGAVRGAAPALVAQWRSVSSLATSWEQRAFERPGWRSCVARVICLTVAAGVFIATLSIAWPEWVLARAYGGGGLVILVAAAALWVAHARRGWLTLWLGLTVTLALFGLSLAALWQDVVVHYNAIGGLLPFSDAQGYYVEANRLLEGRPLAWSARRPLFTAYLAVLLAATGSLYVALAVMVALTAVAAFLLASEVRRSFGPTAAMMTTLVLFAFYRRDGGTGTVLTENLGLLLGIAALTGLLRGVRLQDLRSYTIGAAVLTAALMARAGAFLVLPALMAVAPISMRQHSGGTRLTIRSALVTFAAIALAGVALLAWGKTVSNSAASTAFSNYSQSLYGLVVGGKGWTQVHIDHPNAQEGAEIYALAFEAFRARPRGLMEGISRMARAYLWPNEPYHAFAFVVDASRTIALQRACYVLALIGLAACVWRWRDPLHALLLAMAAGHLASIPFVPPIDAGLRVYAATIPVVALIVAAGSSVPGKLLGAVWQTHGNRTAPPPVALLVTTRLAETAALALVVLIMGTAWTLYAAGDALAVTRAACPSGSESLIVRVDNDAILRIRGDGAPRAISPTAIRETEAQLSIGTVELKGEARNLRAGMSLVLAYDLLDGRQVWLAGAADGLEARPGVLQICGRLAADALARRYGLIYVDSASPLTRR